MFSLSSFQNPSTTFKLFPVSLFPSLNDGLGYIDKQLSQRSDCKYETQYYYGVDKEIWKWNKVFLCCLSGKSKLCNGQTVSGDQDTTDYHCSNVPSAQNFGFSTLYKDAAVIILQI